MTTGADPRSADVAEAEAVAARWLVPHLERPPSQALSGLLRKAEWLLILERAGVSLRDASGGARWAAGLAALRLRALEKAVQGEALVRVGQLSGGEQVLDCTLGLAQDARVAARLVGPAGRVVGLELSLPLAMLAAEGLRRERGDSRSASIEVRCADYREFLAAQPAKSFDVVLFDPMFSRQRKSQPSFALLRRAASPARLEPEALAEARRVARRLVLVKAGRYGPELKQLGLAPQPASRSATVVWARVGPSGH